MTNIIIVNVYEVNNYIIYRKRKIPSLDLIPPGYGWEWCSNWKIDPYYTGFGRKWIRKKICVLTTIPFYKMQEIDLYKDAHGSADLYEYDEYDEENTRKSKYKYTRKYTPYTTYYKYRHRHKRYKMSLLLPISKLIILF